MFSPLPQRLRSLRRRVRRMVWVHGACLLAAGGLGVLLLLGALDYTVRFQDPGLRILISLGFFAAVVGFGYRYLYLPGKIRFRDEDLARRLQRRYPALGDRLLSTVEFLRQEEDDPTAGSPALRRTVIAETTAQTETLDFQAVLDGRPPRRAAVLAGTVLALAAAVFIWDPPVARTAVVRLLNPFNRSVFPQANHLRVSDPVKCIARGGTFEIEIVDANHRPLPREVRVFYRVAAADGPTEEETTVLRPAGQAVVVRRENVVRPFAYRIEGGDDRSMTWREVAVVEPPAVAAVSVRLISPAYTGWPATRSLGDVRALKGTRLEFTGRANKPLRSAVLVWVDERRFPARMHSDRRGFTVSAPELIVTESGMYGFALEDTAGIGGGENDRWEVHAVADAPPTVTIEQPPANLYVTPQAVLPLRVQAKDDLALRAVTLVYPVQDSLSLRERDRVRASLPGNKGGGLVTNISPHPNPLPKGEGTNVPETRVALYTGPEKVPPQAESLLDRGGDLRTIDFAWELEPLGLRPGGQLEFAVTATDYRPRTGRSEPRKLTVVTPQELQDRLSARQNLLLGELQRVLKMQNAVRGQVEAVRIRWEESVPVAPADIDQLRAAELSQRQAALLLSRGGEGIPRQIKNLLADLEHNRLEASRLKDRLEELASDLARLERESLPAVARELTAALKTGQIALSNPAEADLPAARRALQAVGKNQEQVIAVLTAWINRLSQWESSQRFQRELIQLTRDQEETARRTTAVGRRTFARDFRDLAPPEAAELRILAARQAEHARTLDRVLQTMEQSLPDLRQKDPAAAGNVADAVDEAHRQGASNRMRSCGDFLLQNRIGQAADAQKQIARQLQELLDVLSRRRDQELEVLHKKLRTATAEAAELERRQTELHAAMSQAAEKSGAAEDKRQWESLAETQRRLEQETEQLARRLERLQAARAAQAAQQAAAAMNKARREAAAGEGQGACRQAEAARKALADARRRLDEHGRRAGLDLALEQIARLEDAVKHLQQQQQGVLEETRRYERLRQTQGEFTRSQAAGLHDLARRQEMLEDDARRLATDLRGADAFAWTLTRAARSMGQAAAGLNRRRTGTETQRTEQTALDCLALLMEAVQPEPPSDQENAGGDAGGAGKKPPSHAPRGAVATMAELKLLRLLQQELNLRTARLYETLDPQAKPTESQRAALAELARQQGRLAEMVFKLVPPAAEAPEENLQDAPADAEQIWMSDVPKITNTRARLNSRRLTAAQNVETDSAAVSRRLSDAYYLLPDDSDNAEKDSALQEQLRHELGAAAEKEAEQPLLDVARRMFRIQERIAGAQTGPATQAEQQQVVEELDRLIRVTRKSCCGGSPSPNRSPSSARNPTDSSPAKPGSRPAVKAGPRSSDKSPSGRPNVDDVRAALKQHWGELPPQLRQQMLESATEEFMPKYQELLEEYYRRLAEEKKQ
ncbi:MAG: hypothetical protein JXB10_05770 [Pirellulales bacterium]|nr:hypothetical protein [Pirellulales bacterium]